MSKLKVFSGECCLCDVGIPIANIDCDGTDLHTGDIVFLWSGDYVGTELECWIPHIGLTVIVMNQYQSYSDGSIIENLGPHDPFAMGIKDCGLNSPEWRIQIVKKWSDVIKGEHWPAFGFGYR